MRRMCTMCVAPRHTIEGFNSCAQRLHDARAIANKSDENVSQDRNDDFFEVSMHISNKQQQ